MTRLGLGLMIAVLLTVSVTAATKHKKRPRVFGPHWVRTCRDIGWARDYVTCHIREA